MDIVLYVGIALGMAVFMEGVAWFTHKYVMHGFLWILHRDHHQPKRRGFQKNDLFAVFFAAISITLIYVGVFRSVPVLTSMGIGVALYGVGYFLFHDVMFHRRLQGFHIKSFNPYLERIVHAHRIHHRHNQKEDSERFGFLYASPSVWDDEV